MISSFDDFSLAIRLAIETSIKNDIVGSSKSAVMRQNQFLKWFENIFENFEQDANRDKNNRQCISQRFPDNNPGLINRLGFIQSFIQTTSRLKTGAFKVD